MDLPSPILSKDNYGKSRWTPALLGGSRPPLVVAIDEHLRLP